MAKDKKSAVNNDIATVCIEGPNGGQTKTLMPRVNLIGDFTDRQTEKLFAVGRSCN